MTIFAGRFWYVGLQAAALLRASRTLSWLRFFSLFVAIDSFESVPEPLRKF